jgi:DNA-binding NarL/FixJ family response regulator
MRAFVTTFDQRGSRAGRSEAASWASELNRRHAQSLTRPFAVTAGDEIQALIQDPSVLIDVVWDTLRAGAWWVGVGIGEVEEPVADIVNAATGEAFFAARQAVDEAKKRAVGVAVRGRPEAEAEALEGVLAIVSHLLRSRSASQQATIDRAERGLTQEEIASELGISQQAVSKRLASAGWAAEAGARRAAAVIARSLVANGAP